MSGESRSKNIDAKYRLRLGGFYTLFCKIRSPPPPGGFWGPGAAAPGQGVGQSTLRASSILPAPPRAVLWARAKTHCLGGVC
jgi:hypothetical protein